MRYLALLGVLLISCGPREHHVDKSYLREPQWKSFKEGEGFSVPIPEMEVHIHFRSPDEIKSENDKDTYAFTVFAKDSTSGFCEVTLPSRKKVIGTLGDTTGSGEDFEEEYFAKAFAHELLHCIVGNFHS